MRRAHPAALALMLAMNLASLALAVHCRVPQPMPSACALRRAPAAPRHELIVMSEEEDGIYADPGAWRIDQQRLQEAWSAQVRKRKPRFLSFQHARQWARAMYFTTEKDWRRWINNGEKRNPYVPSNPEVVYAEKGWTTWEDFLNGDYLDES